jgi:hypothetical protein
MFLLLIYNNKNNNNNNVIMKKCYKNCVPIKTMIHGFVTIVCLLPTSTLQSGMRSDSDDVTLNTTNAPLDSVFGCIEAQSGCTIEYDDQLVKREKVTVHVHRVSVNKALKEILKDKSLTYVKRRDRYSIKQRETNGNWMLPSFIVVIYMGKKKQLSGALKDIGKISRKLAKKARKKLKTWFKK